MLNLRKTPSFGNEEVQKSEGILVGWTRMVLPPFIIFTVMWLYKTIRKIVHKVKGLGTSDEIEAGEISKEFNRRRYEEHLQALKLTQEDLGFTNQVLFQENRKAINYYLPVYITNKIKSIQDVSVQNLTGNISCAMIINIGYEGLPEEIIQRLESSIIIQLNRGEAIKLEDDGISITVKRDKKSNFLIFTIRKLFLAFLLEDTLWSPFELLELIISVTLNTVSIAPHSLKKVNEKSEYSPEKEYKISFNCMRNSDCIPISYALDCVFGIYDLAEKKLEAYHSKFGTYSEIQRNFEDFEAKERKKRKEERSKLAKELDSPVKKDVKGEEKSEKAIGNKAEDKRKVKTEQKLQEQPNSLLDILAQSTMKRLSIRPSTEAVKKPPAKVKYFQYSHFVIPLYKYPGNSLATIFIPIFLLALVSLAIFFQEPQLSGRIGAIATMILGYIALIPSIKEQLPPSSKLTVIETVVYIETMCCLLCLYQSFSIDGNEEYNFIWYENYTFLLCLGTHISTFIFIIGVYTVHKLKWEPEYNCDEKVIEIKPGDNRLAWDNPYCDEVFLKFNKAIKTGRYTDKEREEMIIKPLNWKKDMQSKKSIDLQIKQQHKMENKDVNGFSNTFKKTEERPIEPHVRFDIKKTTQEFLQIQDPSDFQIPDPNLYYNGEKIKNI